MREQAEEPDVPTPAVAVRGVYNGHDIDRGFTYRFACAGCGRTFLESTPEVSAPCLCHRCFKGMRDERHVYATEDDRQRDLQRRRDLKASEK